jgi:hypothetical protein
MRKLIGRLRRNIVVGGLAAALLVAGALAAPSGASAQVIIQGEVTAYPSQPQYGRTQPQPVYVSPYVQQTSTPPPQRYIHHSDSIRALWIPGILALGGGFLFSVFADLAVGQECSSFSSRGCPSTDWQLLTWIPVVGPWLGLGIGDPGDYAWVNYVGGILQGAGLLMMILGLSIHDEWDEPLYAFDPSDPLAPTLSMDGGPTGGNVTLTF